MRSKKIIVNQILLSKLWYRGQIYTIPKYIKKEIEKRIYNFLWSSKKYDLPDNYLNSRSGLGILDTDSQLNCIKTKWIVIKHHQCSLERSHAVVILNSDQGLALFRQKRSLGLLVTKINKNWKMKISLFNCSMLDYI